MHGERPDSAPGPRGKGAAIDDLRRRGVRGGIIARHRAMAGFRLTPLRVAAAAVAALLGVAGLRVGLSAVAPLWVEVFRVGAEALAIPGGVETRVWEVGAWAIAFPSLAAAGAWPEPSVWLAGCGVCAAVLLATTALPPALLPLTYFLRALVCLQTSALVYFAVAQGPFPYRLGDYAVGLFTSGVVVILFVPLLFGCTYYLSDVSWPRKILLTVATAAHLVVFLPAKVLLHVYLIHRLTHLVMPLLFFGFGVLLDIFVVIAFYCWGMSWPSPGEDSRSPAPAAVA